MDHSHTISMMINDTKKDASERRHLIILLMCICAKGRGLLHHHLGGVVACGYDVEAGGVEGECVLCVEGAAEGA